MAPGKAKEMNVLPVDVEVPHTPGSLMQSAYLDTVGRWRIARKNAELYSVQITSAGAWAQLIVANGRGRTLFHMPSTFTGSFWLGAGADDGIVVTLVSQTMAPIVTVNFRELRK